jgi:K+-transporting ATPase KdpF subunit
MQATSDIRRITQLPRFAALTKSSSSPYDFFTLARINSYSKGCLKPPASLCQISFTSCSRCCSSSSAGFSPRRAIGSDARKGAFMDYIIGGITSVFLFAYLIYALLRPEKF